MFTEQRAGLLRAYWTILKKAEGERHKTQRNRTCRYNLTETDLRPPGTLPQGQVRDIRTLRETCPPDRYRGRNAERGRQGPDLHTICRNGCHAEKLSPGNFRERGSVPAWRRREGKKGRNGQEVPGSPRRSALLRPLTQSADRPQLQATTCVFDRWWNPAAEQQAVDRHTG